MLGKACKPLKLFSDIAVTSILWVYFIIAGIFMMFFFFALYFFSGSREEGFQAVSHYYYKGFFMLMKFVTPGLNISIDPEIAKISSSIVVSNHLSYLDPILLVSILKKQRTIIKGTFFKVPVFGWVVKNSGYIPFYGNDIFNTDTSDKIEGLGEYLKKGGNIFIFPEGTRSRDGSLGRFKKGAFSIANRLEAPVAVLYIENTGKLFIPGRFLFNTMEKNEIKVEILSRIPPKYDEDISISSLSDRVRELLKTRLESGRSG